MLLLLAVTLAGGAVITFTPQMIDSATVAACGLLLMGLAAAVARWRIGLLADRHGAQRFLVPLVPLTGASMALLAWSVADAGAVRVGSFLVAMFLIGVSYGGLQNLTLVISFDAVSRRHHNLASAVWNVGFDAGTALGSVAVGVIAQLTSFTTAFLLAAAITAATLPLGGAAVVARLRQVVGARTGRTRIRHATSDMFWWMGRRQRPRPRGTSHREVVHAAARRPIDGVPTERHRRVPDPP